MIRPRAMTAPDASLGPYYAARAGEYERIYAKPERQADLRAIEKWLPPRFAGANVLEVACGTGYWTRFIAPVAASILAIDTAPETLCIARERIADPHVHLQVGDAYALPQPATRFDAAFAGFWFSHVPVHKRSAFLRGLNASLKPGARVVLLDNSYVEGSSSPIAKTDEQGNTYQMRRLDDGSVTRVLKNFPGPGDLLAAVAGLGKNASIKHWQHYWVLEYAAAGA